MEVLKVQALCARHPFRIEGTMRSNVSAEVVQISFVSQFLFFHVRQNLAPEIGNKIYRCLFQNMFER